MSPQISAVHRNNISDVTIYLINIIVICIGNNIIVVTTNPQLVDGW